MLNLDLRMSVESYQTIKKLKIKPRLLIEKIVVNVLDLNF